MSRENSAPPPPPPPPPRNDSPPSSGGNSLREAVSIPIGGGLLEPAKVSRGYGLRWTKKFSEGGKTKSASSRADGIAKRGKTKGKYL
jgi:hypothetical protein